MDIEESEHVNPTISRIQIAVLCIGIVSNVIGLLAIYSYKKKTNQSLILGCLTVTESFNIIAGMLIMSFIFKIKKLFLAEYFFTGLILFNIVYLVYSIISYIIAYVVVRRSREMFGTSRTQQDKKVAKILLVPGILISTFIIFNVIPFVIMLPEALRKQENDIKYQICKLITFGGFIVDPLSYVLLMKHYRKSIKVKLSYFICT